MSRSEVTDSCYIRQCHHSDQKYSVLVDRVEGEIVVADDDSVGDFSVDCFHPNGEYATPPTGVMVRLYEHLRKKAGNHDIIKARIVSSKGDHTTRLFTVKIYIQDEGMQTFHFKFKTFELVDVDYE